MKGDFLTFVVCELRILGNLLVGIILLDIAYAIVSLVIESFKQYAYVTTLVSITCFIVVLIVSIIKTIIFAFKNSKEEFKCDKTKVLREVGSWLSGLA